MAVGCDVDHPALGSAVSEDVFGRILPDKQFSPFEKPVKRLNFVQYGRRLRVGDTEDERSAGGICGSALAQRKDAGAWRVGHGVAVNQVLSAIEQSVERDVVQQAVGHEDKMTGLQPGGDRCDKFLIELGQVRLSGLHQRILEGFDVLRIEPELGKLELQQPQKTRHSRFQRYRNNFKSFLSQQTHQDAILNSKKLDT